MGWASPAWAVVPAIVAGLIAGFGAVAAGADTLRILPLGDSITEGHSVPGGYRPYLYNSLTSAGVDVDFVGWLNNNPHPDLPDPDHSGHSGWRIDQIEGVVATNLSSTPADIILLHIGTNDFYAGWELAKAKSRLNDLIYWITSIQPDAHLIVSTIIPIMDPNQEQASQTLYNPFIDDIVAQYAAAGKHVSFVDMHGAFDPATDMKDMYHPTPLGYSKMADVWEAGIYGTGLVGGVSGVAIPLPGSAALLPVGAMLIGAVRLRRYFARK